MLETGKDHIMAAQRFVAPDMRRALRQVRESLGADAIILSHRRVAEGIELLASTESEPPPRSAGAEEVTPEAAARGVEQGGELSRLQEEMHTLRALLERQLSAQTWDQLRQRRPGHAGMWERLTRMGLDAELCQLLLARFDEALPPAESWQLLMRDLADLVPTTEPDPVQRGGVFALVGPAGAGKTTCVARLATRHALEHGSAGLALVTTDHYRIGAQAQLRTVSEILGVPLLTARGEGELASLLYRLRHERLVLIDTPGLARSDPRLAAGMAELEQLGDRLQVLQVLPTTSHSSVLKADQHAYRSSRLAGVILTRLDEAASLGEALSLLVRRNLPLAYTSDGQDIPGDLVPASARSLVAAAIALARRQQLDERQLARAMTRVTMP